MLEGWESRLRWRSGQKVRRERRSVPRIHPELQNPGYRVFATSRTSVSMHALREAEIETFELDVTSAQDVADVRDRIGELTGGRLDILVNNA